ncbi:MAG TPA: glycosyltransferase family 25 protein [Chitinophagaceae bacterium]|nr:glycosyltransferase family 25 protein [Chitinophagaceae bacterium]
MPGPKDINEVLQSYVDKVLVLTVPRFRERQQKVKQRLEGISFEFFYGCDKNELTPQFIHQHYTYDKKNSLAVSYNFKPLNTGEIACSLSHRNIYQAMIDNNWQRVLVLEDDVVPDKDKLVLLKDCLNELPDDWELLYLGYMKNERPTFGRKIKQGWYKIMAALGMSRIPLKMIKNRLPKNYSTHLWKAGFHDCTHAYAVSISGAKKLLAVQTPVIYRADNLLSALVMKDEIKAFASKSFLFNQEVFTDNTDQSQIREKWANQ